MVATSASRKKRSLTRRLTARKALFRGAYWPLTRRLTRLGAGLHDAGRRHRVLRLQALQHRLLVEAEPGDLPGREVEIDDLVLRADQVDLAGAGNLQDLGARLFGIVAQLAEREPVGGEGVDVAEDVAELVVEERALHAGGKLRLDVVDLVAHLNPDGADVAARAYRPCRLTKTVVWPGVV